MESGFSSYPMSELSFPMEQFMMDLSLCSTIVSKFFGMDAYFDIAPPTATIATQAVLTLSLFLHLPTDVTREPALEMRKHVCVLLFCSGMHMFYLS
jgi:hypothetical protein